MSFLSLITGEARKKAALLASQKQDGYDSDWESGSTSTVGQAASHPDADKVSIQTYTSIEHAEYISDKDQQK